jgi:L-threonylcarbamoyladenylate synthase
VNNKKINEIIKSLRQGGVGIIPTDTLYGLVGRAEDKKVVAQIVKLKKRSKGKPFIILISSLNDLEKFGVKINKKTSDFLKTIWPGPVSVALSSRLSFRLPKNKLLIKIIKKTGPLVAPSANPEGFPPATTIAEAKNYFGNQINFYLAANKKLNNQPSTLIKIEKDKIKILRPGRYRLSPTTLK